VFETLRPIAKSEEPAKCPQCGATADRILTTTFASRTFRGGSSRRVPFHHHPVRADAPKKPIARVKPKPEAKPAATAKRNKKAGGKS
jgi:hypothetical protein